MPVKRNGLATPILCVICVLCLLSTILCSCGDVIVEPKWVVGVKGVDAPVFSSLDYGKLREVSVTMETTQPDGSVLEETWQGVYLWEVLDYLDAAEYSTVTLTAADGTACEYSSALINESSIILATKRNGRELEKEGLLYTQVIAVGQGQSLCPSKLDRITINE